MASIHSIYHYPIKGCRAVKIAASDVTTGGLVGDRQWVLVNQDGIVNQKKLPTLRFLDIALEQDGMTLSLKGAERQATSSVVMPSVDAIWEYCKGEDDLERAGARQ